MAAGPVCKAAEHLPRHSALGAPPSGPPLLRHFPNRHLQALRENRARSRGASHVTRASARGSVHLAVNNCVSPQARHPPTRETRAIKDAQKSPLRTLQAGPKKGFQNV